MEESNMGFNIDLKMISIAVVIALIIGTGAGYMIGNSPVSGHSADLSSLMEERDQLEAEYDSLSLDVQALEEELKNSVSIDEYSDLERLVAQLESELEDSVSAEDAMTAENNRLQTELQQLRSLNPRWIINITALVEKWMTPQPENLWDQKFEYFDIQLLLVVNVAKPWADNIAEDFVAEFEKQGGEVAFVGRYAEESRPNVNYMESFLAGNVGPKEKAMVEYYGLDHMGILFIGGVEIGIFYQDRGLLSSELPLIAIGSDNRLRYIDPMWQ